MDQPYTRWICDTCHGAIESVSEGYVIWKSKQTEDEGYAYYDFKIVHQKRCDQRDHSSSIALAQVLGPDGLTYMLSMLSAGPLLSVEGISSCRIEDFDGYVDFLRRVQTPHYEEARHYFDVSEVRELYEGSNQTSPYLSRNLRRLVSNQNDAD